MRRYFWIVIAVMVLSHYGCKKDSDVLAVFKGGEITRGDFYNWIENRRLSKEMLLKDKSRQKSRLRQMATDVLSVKEAEKAGFDKDENFLKLIGLAKQNFTAGFLRKIIRDDGSFKEEAVKVSVIKLQIKNYRIENNKRRKLSKTEEENEFKKKIAEARTIVEKLEKGDSFQALAKKYSNDYSKKSGGDIGYITRGMRGPDFSKVVFSMKTGEFTKEPVKLRNGVYIFKVDDKKELTDKNIDDVIKDEKQSARLKKRLLLSYARGFEKKLRKADDVETYFDNVSSSDPETELFKIGDEVYKVADLNMLLDFIKERRAGPNGRTITFDERKKKNYTERIFTERLLVREAMKRGIDKDEKYINAWKVYRDATLAGVFRQEISQGNIKVTKDEVRAEYNKNKDRAYTSRTKKGKKTIKKVKPYAEVKERIYYMLFNRKRALKRRIWEKELITKNNFKIIETELEVKK